MTDHKLIYMPTIKEPNIIHALATSSAFNLKLCLRQFGLLNIWSKGESREALLKFQPFINVQNKQTKNVFLLL